MYNVIHNINKYNIGNNYSHKCMIIIKKQKTFIILFIPTEY